MTKPLAVVIIFVAFSGAPAARASRDTGGGNINKEYWNSIEGPQSCDGEDYCAKPRSNVPSRYEQDNLDPASEEGDPRREM